MLYIALTASSKHINPVLTSTIPNGDTTYTLMYICTLMYYHVLSCTIMYSHVRSCVVMYVHFFWWWSFRECWWLRTCHMSAWRVSHFSPWRYAMERQHQASATLAVARLQRRYHCHSRFQSVSAPRRGQTHGCNEVETRRKKRGRDRWANKYTFYAIFTQHLTSCLG